MLHTIIPHFSSTLIVFVIQVKDDSDTKLERRESVNKKKLDLEIFTVDTDVSITEEHSGSCRKQQCLLSSVHTGS